MNDNNKYANGYSGKLNNCAKNNKINKKLNNL